MEEFSLDHCCVSCIHFTNSYNEPGYGYCRGNIKAFKEMTGKNFTRGAPEGPSFKVRKLAGCSQWQRAW